MLTNNTHTDGKGSANLINELNKIFDIYTNELREWRTSGVLGDKLSDEKAFDIVIKLLDKSDKIKKLGNGDAEEAETGVTSAPKNIQDYALKKA